DLGEHGEPLLGDEAGPLWIEAARAVLERIQPVAGEGVSGRKRGKLDLFRREPLDRMPKKCGDSGGHGAPLPDRVAEHKRTLKAGVSMSDPTPGPVSGPRAKLPYHLAPWLAVAAMAAAALWPKGRK